MTRVACVLVALQEYKKEFVRVAEATKIGDPFEEGVQHGPQIDKAQYERIMNYIQSGMLAMVVWLFSVYCEKSKIVCCNRMQRREGRDYCIMM